MGLIFRKDLKTLETHDLKGGFLVGLMLFIAFYTQLAALRFTDPGKQAFLAGTYVIFVPFMVWFIYKKKPDLKSFIATSMCFIGISLLTLGDQMAMNLGDSLTVLSSVFFAGHIIATKHFVKSSSPVKISLVQFATVAFLSTGAVIISGQIPGQIQMDVLLPILYLGLVCTGLAYYLQTLAQKYAKTTHTAIILSLEAVFGSLLSVVIVHEVFTPKMILGSVIILGSILVVELKVERQSIERVGEEKEIV